jgi:phosphoribosyl-AMP cyclohydrolase
MTGGRSAATKRSRFAARGATHDIEEGLAFAPKFDQNGLIGCVVTDATTGEVLMFAHMNEDALARTIETGDAWFYSRSRAALWRKGESSGHTLRVRELRVDCDQDALWIKAEPQGPGACHTGRRSCFYRAVRLESAAGPATRLEFRDGERVFDPAKVYGGKPQG